jgi:catechol-2,3-dioxygenase
MLGQPTATLIECRDLERMESFYTETLGLRVKDRGEGWLDIDGGGQLLVLWQGEKPEVVIGFTGAELQPARELLESRGADPTPIRKHPGGQHFYVTDPEGNTVMIGDT